ncbi:hypothetical protein EJB05_26009 [Eragrostis curvula]|uniref:non-specific serine/threonine protein kinase n=1 Tax=Eragrostis curvula TaxID=38414 RepID=A0A5J9UIP2_9POAL|nr:hypothetical protein EJB05_26009 [Eragrostis curvula]
MKCLEMRRPIDGLEETLRQAYMLVTSCQSSNVMYRFIMAGNQAQQFRDIRDRIDSFLRIYPIISHIDTRYFIRGLYSRTHPSGAEPEALEEMRESFTSHLDPDSRFKGTASDDNGIESVEARELTVPLAVQVMGMLSCLQRGGIDFGGFFKELKWRHQQLTPYVGSMVMWVQGVLPNGVDVAIKISRTNDKRHLVEFENEIQTIPRLQHANIIKLLGYCIKGDRRILVYEYMPNGSVWDRIHELKDDTLSWPMRFRIIEGIVQGAVYLHQHSRPRVIHRDLKASNIVLDRDMNPRITDFGLAVVLNSDEDEKDMPVAGTLHGSYGHQEE